MNQTRIHAPAQVVLGFPQYWCTALAVDPLAQWIATDQLLTGRSAIYTFRQLYDFKAGVRHGAWSAMMKPAVQNLTMDDMIAIVAYTSSRMP